MAKPKDDWLHEQTRAEDIILGSLGLGDEAKISTIVRTSDGFEGVAIFDDGETYPFESEDELTDLEQWALSILLNDNTQKKAS